MPRCLVMYSLTVVLLALVGCQKSARQSAKEADKAIEQTLQDVPMFAESRAASYWGISWELTDEQIKGLEEVSPAQARDTQQKLQRLDDDQVARFNAVIDRLETTLSGASADAAEISKSIAMAHGLAAELRTYRARWRLNEYIMDSVSVFDRQEVVRRLALRMGMLTAEGAKLSAEMLAGPIAESQKRIGQWGERKAVTESQIAAVDKAIEHVQASLDTAVRQRDAISLQITEEMKGFSALSAEPALAVRKTVNKLEQQRFEVSAYAGRLTSGPYDLPAEYAVKLDDRTLTQIGGLHQLEQEKAILQQRLAHIEQGIQTQTDHLKHLRDQKKLNAKKAVTVAGQADELAGQRMGPALTALSSAVTDASALIQQVREDLDRGETHADQGRKAIAQYFGTLRKASSELKSGQRSDWLDQAKAASAVTLVMDNAAVEVYMAQGRLARQELEGVQSLSAVLHLTEGLVDLPEDLSAQLAGSEERIVALTARIGDVMGKAIEIAEGMVKQAKGGEMKAACQVMLAGVYYRAALLLPEQSETLLDEARKIRDELLAPENPYKPDPDSLGAAAVSQLVRILETK